MINAISPVINRFRRITPALSIIILLACNHANLPSAEAGKPEQSQPVPEQPPAGPGFRFSTMAPVSGGTVADNWCLGRFNEPTVMNAEKENVNRRYFYLSPGATKIAIGPTGMTAAFILRPVGNGVVEIFNGAHFPGCLSMPANFSAPGPVVRYHNHKNLTFSMEVREEGGFSLVTIELPPGHRYSMDVSHCSNCE